MNIAFDGRVLRHEKYSGVEKYTFNIYRNIKEKVHLFTPPTDNRYLQQLWEHTILPISSAKVDLLFCPSNIAPLWIPGNTRLVMTIHDVAFKEFPENFSKIFTYYYHYVIPKNIEKAYRIITVSKASKKEILKHYPQARDKIHVIPLGIEEKFRVLSGEKIENRILYVGSINERKNITGVIKAFEMLPESLGATLVVVGNFFENFPISGKTKIILERAIRNPRIQFKTDLDDDALIREYNDAECFLFPSFYEGFGLPPLEAMACGTPVITSNISSMPEICDDAAIYVDPYNPQDIADKIYSLLTDKDLQKKMISKGFAHVNTFSWEKAAQAHLKLFEEILM